MPTTARRARTMICATAKSTDVSRRQRPRPTLARMDSPVGRIEAVETAAGVAMTGS
jgi:hypothetical protein